MNFQPSDPPDGWDDTAPCDRCTRQVPNDESHLFDGEASWSGFYLCGPCHHGLQQVLRLQKHAAFMADRARQWPDDTSRVLAQLESAKWYRRTREILGIDDVVNSGA